MSVSVRLRYLLVPLVLLAACDSAVSPLGEEADLSTAPVLESRGALFSGPDVSVFEVGSRQIVDYFVEHPDEKTIDVGVLEFPAGADYSITDVAGSYSKKITVTWSPGNGTESRMHAVTMLARTREDGSESLGNFDIYVNAK